MATPTPRAPRKPRSPTSAPPRSSPRATSAPPRSSRARFESSKDAAPKSDTSLDDAQASGTSLDGAPSRGRSAPFEGSFLCEVCDRHFSLSHIAIFITPHSHHPEGRNLYSACESCISEHGIVGHAEEGPYFVRKSGQSEPFAGSSVCEVCDRHFPRRNVVWYIIPHSYKPKSAKHPKGRDLWSACESCIFEHQIYGRVY